MQFYQTCFSQFLLEKDYIKQIITILKKVENASSFIKYLLKNRLLIIKNCTNILQTFF